MFSKSLANFYRQYATMLDAGLHHQRALSVIAEQQGGSVRALSRKLLLKVKQGDQLSEAMATMPGIFIPLHLTLIRAGERSGTLDKAMIRIADSLDFNFKIKADLILRLIYPFLVLNAAFVILSVVRGFLSGAETSAGKLLAGLVFLALTMGTFYGVLLVVFILFKLGRKVPVIRMLLDDIAFNVPILAGITRNLCTARFAYTCEALYSAGINMAEAVTQSALATGNLTMQRRVMTAVPVIKEGISLTKALTSTQAFTPMINSMLATGAESGKLDVMLQKVAEQAEHQAHISIQRLGIIIPILIFLGLALFLAIVIIMLFAGYINMLNELLQ